LSLFGETYNIPNPELKRQLNRKEQKIAEKSAKPQVPAKGNRIRHNFLQSIYK
jgi:hypothetical protein